MFAWLSMLGAFGGRKIASAPVRILPANTLHKWNLYAEQALGQVTSTLIPALRHAQSSLIATGRAWEWQYWFVFALCLLYLLFVAVTVTRARRVCRRQLRDARELSLEQLKTELEGLLAEGRAECARLVMRNKFSLTAANTDAVDADAEGEGDTPGWQWREIRDHIMRQRHF